MLGHDMFAIEVFRNQLIDLQNLIQKILRLDAFPFGDVGDSGERAFPPYQILRQAAFSYSIVQVQQGQR